MLRYNASLRSPDSALHEIAMVADVHDVPHQTEAKYTGRLARRFRFGLRTLLLLPVVATALLLIAFPKLLTGDFVEARVASIEEAGGTFYIEFDARISSGTDWSTTLYGGGTCSVSGASQSHWSDMIPTWPKHKLIQIRLGMHNRLAETDPIDMLAVQQGMSYYVTPRQPLELARNHCRFQVRRGSRFGL